MGYGLGIDIGTTFSAAAVFTAEGVVELINLGGRSASIPSVVLPRESGEILIGDAAEIRATTDPTRVAREFKRRLGDPTPLVLGGTPYSAQALTTLLIRHIHDFVIRRMDATPDTVVITHPAEWSEYRRDNLQAAAREAGVSNVVLVSEPAAAAAQYASRATFEPGEVIAVYDFGGGTFDIALLKHSATGFEVLGQPVGVESLGGVDFDVAVLGYVNEQVGGAFETLDPTEEQTLAVLARLRRDSREAKEALSSDVEASISVIVPGTNQRVNLTRAAFEGLVRPRIAETFVALRRALDAADLTIDEINRIVLVGGSSRIPYIRERVAIETGRPIADDIDPEYAVALGAARLASPSQASRNPTRFDPDTSRVAESMPAVPETEIVQPPEVLANNSSDGDEPFAAEPDPRSDPLARASALAIDVPEKPQRAPQPKPTRNRRMLIASAVAIVGIGALALATIGGGDPATSPATTPVAAGPLDTTIETTTPPTTDSVASSSTQAAPTTVASDRAELTPVFDSPLNGIDGSPTARPFSPDGKQLVTYRGNSYSILSPSTGSVESTVRAHEGSISGATFNADGTMIATISKEDRNAKVWDAASGALISTTSDITGDGSDVAFSPDGSMIVTSSNAFGTMVWNATTGQFMALLPTPDLQFVWTSAFSPDSTRLLTVNSNTFPAESDLTIWDPRTGASLMTWTTTADLDASWSSDGSKVVANSFDKVAVYDAATGAELWSKQLSNTDEMDVDAASQFIAGRSSASGASVWDLASGSEHSNFCCFGDGATTVRFSPNGDKVVTASRDGKVRLFTIAGEELSLDLSHTRGVTIVYVADFSPDGRFVYANFENGSTVLWDLAGTTAAP